MPTQGMFARPWSRWIVCGLIYGMALQWSAPSHAEEPHPSSARRTVYRCLHDGVLTLTDMPCNGERVEIDLNRNISIAQSRGSSDSAQIEDRKDGRTPKRASVTAAAEQRREKQERCARLRAQLGTLQSKLRRGYTAEAGIRLEARKRQLREQERSAKCPSG